MEVTMMTTTTNPETVEQAAERLGVLEELTGLRQRLAGAVAKRGEVFAAWKADQATDAEMDSADAAELSARSAEHELIGRIARGSL